MEMLAYAQVELGLTENQFWDLTFAQFVALQRVRDRQIFRRNYRAGIITATMRAIVGDKKARPMDPFTDRQKEHRRQVRIAARALKRQQERERNGR